MNIITDLTRRIETRRQETSNPCKNYATHAAAEKATHAIALKAASTYLNSDKAAPYVVFYNEAWKRWVGAVDIQHIIAHKDFIGGYIGLVSDAGFFTY